MARSGAFSQPAFVFGAPISVIKPPDNRFPKYDPAIEAMKGVSEKDKRDLQQQIDELAATLGLARDYKY